jgi:ATP-dependent DNA ligase
MAFQPMPLARKPAPFDHPEWVFELKYDGFRSFAATTVELNSFPATDTRSIRSTRFANH